MKFIKLLAVFALVIAIEGHQPTIEQSNCQGRNLVDCAVGIQDPTFASVAVYGSLSAPREVDVYKIEPQLSETIPIEVLVPVRPHNQAFRPAIVIFGQDLTGLEWVETSHAADHSAHNHTQVPFEVPDGYQFHLIAPPEGERSFFFEPYSVESLWHGREEQIPVQAGRTYYIAVFTPDFQTGDYSLGLGAKENFANASYLKIIGNILKIKMGLASGKTTGWVDFFGLFSVILGIGLGLGASFFGLLSSEKNFAWANCLALILSIIGTFFAYSLSGLSGIMVFQIICFVILFVTLLLLTLKDRRRDSRPRTFGIVFLQLVLLLCWLAALGLLVWHILVLR
jgi:hypothetical protein